MNMSFRMVDWFSTAIRLNAFQNDAYAYFIEINNKNPIAISVQMNNFEWISLQWWIKMFETSHLKKSLKQIEVILTK